VLYTQCLIPFLFVALFALFNIRNGVFVFPLSGENDLTRNLYCTGGTARSCTGFV
jgi:hypothetical protein